MAQLVALALPGGPRFIEELQRAWDAGHAVLPLDMRLPKAMLDKQIKAMKPSVLVDDHLHHHELDGGLPVEPGDALVMATSGTTGEPKGVVLTHDSVRASAEITSTRLGVNDTDTWLACLPVSHIGGLSVITRALHTNTALIALPQFDSTQVQDVARRQVTLVSLVATALKRVDTSLFRRILLGGSAPPRDRPANAVATYGMTETGSGVVYDHYPLDGVVLRVGADGQLYIKSPTLLRCYRDGTDPKTHDGWYPTCDAGSVDANQRVEVFGRLDDAINTGGDKVWPSSIEASIKQDARIRDALVHGELDDEWGERVVATVELVDADDIPSLEELRERVKSEIGPMAAPKELRVVDELERTPTGKLRRHPKRPSGDSPPPQTTNG